MSSVVTNVEDICNEALGRIGFPRRIGDIFEGSRQSKLCLEYYGQTRDELLRTYDWGFSERNGLAVLLKQAPLNGYTPAQPWTPAYPAPPWLYEYTYPGDCIKLRAIKSSAAWVPNFSPSPNIFDIANDEALIPPIKVILCNVPNALFVYSGQVTDMTQWDSLFIQAMVNALAEKIAPGIAKIDQAGDTSQKEQVQEKAMDEEMAARMRG